MTYLVYTWLALLPVALFAWMRWPRARVATVCLYAFIAVPVAFTFVGWFNETN